jgi:hypothetical protein
MAAFGPILLALPAVRNRVGPVSGRSVQMTLSSRAREMPLAHPPADTPSDQRRPGDPVFT